MNKEWTVKNGVVGTHHMNRDGEYVDFRQSGQAQASYGKVEVPAPKGQRGIVKPLILDAVRKEQESQPMWLNGCNSVHEMIVAEFMGVEVRAKGNFIRNEWTDPAAKAAHAAEIAERNAKYEEENKKIKDFLETFPIEVFAQKATSSEAARIAVGTLDVRNVVDRIVGDEYRSITGKSFFLTNCLANKRAEIRDAILDYWTKNRAARKAAWEKKKC